MTSDGRAGCLSELESVQADLRRVASTSEAGIESVTQVFKSLADEADRILKQAAGIVGCVGAENVGTVRSTVQSLAAASNAFLEQRLQAATNILELFQGEERLLRQLTDITQSQVSVAGNLTALSVLVKVEVAQLGSAGGSFRSLADELHAFAKSVSEQTVELASNAERRGLAIEKTRHELADSLPQLRSELLCTERDLGKTLQVVEESFNLLVTIPERFGSSVGATSEEIAGAVAAIQAHDITRQQIEHVQQALALISSTIMTADDDRGVEMATAFAGLTIQIGQLKNVRDTVTNWVSQISRCMNGILQLSASDVVDIGAVVLSQERELSSQLNLVAELQRKSQAHAASIQDMAQQLTDQVELVNEHLERSTSIRRRLKLLSFNSRAEACRLGHMGATVSVIANLVNDVSAQWVVITERSRTTLARMLELVEQTRTTMEVFSDAGAQELREHQAHGAAALDGVRRVAVHAASEAEKMQAVAQRMQASARKVGSTGDRLEQCFRGLDTIMARLEGVTNALEANDPRISQRYDAAEAGLLFSDQYTTQVERNVMDAVLQGAPMPVAQAALAGNGVELF